MLKVGLAALGVASLIFVSTAQERVRPKQAADFGGMLSSVRTHWENKAYGACIKDLNELIGLAHKKRAEAIRAALPAAPEGYIKEEAKGTVEANNPFVAAIASGVGNIIEQKYRASSGGGRVDVTVTADSPLVSMLGMMLANPAAAGPNAELIKYGAHKAILKNEGNRLNLQIVLLEAHVVDVTCTGKGEDFLFAMFDQAAVDALAGALSK